MGRRQVRQPDGPALKDLSLSSSDKSEHDQKARQEPPSPRDVSNALKTSLMPAKSNLPRRPRKPTADNVFATVSLFQGLIVDLRVLYSLDGRVYLACLQQHLSPTRMFKHTVPVGYSAGCNWGSRSRFSRAFTSPRNRPTTSPTWF